MTDGSNVIFYRSSVTEITYYSLSSSSSSELLRFLVHNSVQKQSVLYHPGFKAEMKAGAPNEDIVQNHLT